MSIARKVALRPTHPSSSHHFVSSSLIAGGQRPAGSGRGLDSMATSLNTPGYNMMTNTPGLTLTVTDLSNYLFNILRQSQGRCSGEFWKRFKHVRYKLPF